MPCVSILGARRARARRAGARRAGATRGGREVEQARASRGFGRERISRLTQNIFFANPNFWYLGQIFCAAVQMLYGDAARQCVWRTKSRAELFGTPPRCRDFFSLRVHSRGNMSPGITAAVDVLDGLFLPIALNTATSLVTSQKSLVELPLSSTNELHRRSRITICLDGSRPHMPEFSL
jgi:hypothetical protein